MLSDKKLMPASLHSLARADLFKKNLKQEEKH